MSTADCMGAVGKVTTELYYIQNSSSETPSFPLLIATGNAYSCSSAFGFLSSKEKIILRVNVNKMKVEELIKRVTSRAQSQFQVKCSSKHTHWRLL